MKAAQLAVAPVIVGPANALASTGHSWRFNREVIASLPGVVAIRSGDRIVGIIASTIERHVGRAVDAVALDTPPAAQEPEPQLALPETADAVLLALGRRRRSA